MSKYEGLDTPEAWGAASRGYADKVAPHMMAKYVEDFADRLGVEEDHEVLEVAAGSGALTEVLAKRAKSVLATDFSPGMLEVLRARMAEQGHGNIRYAEMDGQALGVADASFDRAACCFGLMLFPDRDKGFSELHRALRPGGRAMVSGWAGPDQFETFAIFSAAVRAVFPELPPPPEPPPVFSLADLKCFESEMTAAGFREVQTAYVERELVIADFDAMWAMLTTGAPPIKMLFHRLGDGGPERVKDSLAALVKERFASGPIRLLNTATVGCGVA